ncbi:A-kinase anchor protein 11 [Chanos chanos]|uniref:A-kinase anchor protein 11 n=1 Tax=Chanos chanos TaxID=29144 RepID=A0A6J2WFD8_CHACN|nr:A-kinase anchor protein 11 [Chanos chanos]
MDACARIRGVPLKNRVTIRKETICESSAVCLKSLLKNRKELCNVLLELHSKDPQCLSEIHFVCLPSLSEGEDVTQQALSSASAEISELLRSLHAHSLKNEEVLLLKDSRRFLERKDSISQNTWSKAMCILRYSPIPHVSVYTILGLLTRYTAGIRYALELQSLQRGISEVGQAEDDDTNQSVSSIEEDFVTAFEHLEEEEFGDYSCGQRNQRDVASQTVPSHCKNVSGSRIIRSSVPKKSISKQKSNSEVSVHKSSATQSSDGENQLSFYTSNSPPKGITSTSLTESDESDCSSPSPIIFLDEVGYQKSLKAKLDIPKIPVLKEGVEDSDSEVSEFFDSFDQFDDLDQSFDTSMKMHEGQTLTSLTQRKKTSDSSGSKFVSRGCSTTAMNPHKFDHPILPANVKKPTPLKPGSPYSVQSEVPDSPQPVRTSGEESSGLFSPVRSSAFSPLGDGGNLEYFWKADGDGLELRKPQDLCALYKTYSDFANNLSKEILGSVCGYASPTDININKNLSCVCHKEFRNTSGHLMKLSDIQETVTIAKSQQKQSLKDGIQRFATDLVEMSLGSALRDLQKGVSSCTTTLCHLAARLTSSVFQMAFQEIGMRHAYLLKERAINGLAGFLVGEAVSGALKEFLFVKKQIFNNTVTRFAADLAEELIFEGIMEVCQFSHPSTPLTPSDWSFEQEEEVVSSYASDLSESVLQEAFIELSQADVTFTTQAAISVSLDNICYVSAEDTSQTTKTCNASTSYLGPQLASDSENSEQDGCTVKKALFCVSGMASCVPVPVAGKAISHLQNPEESCQYKSSISHTCQTSPKRSVCSQGRAVTSTSDTSAATQTDSPPGHFSHGSTNSISGEPSSGKTIFQNFSGNMVDMIVGEAFDLMTTTKVKKKVEHCADFLSKTIGGRIPTNSRSMAQTSGSQDMACWSLPCEDSSAPQKDPYFNQKGSFTDSYCFPSPHSSCSSGSKHIENVTCNPVTRHSHPVSKVASDTHPIKMKDTLEVPSFEVTSRGPRKMTTEEMIGGNSGRKSNGTPGTPPSTPQQPTEISNEKQIKQFSKKLKGKLAKEFSPATPPPTPHYQPASEVKDVTSDSDKADFMLKLMRSLSEEAGSEDHEDEDREEGPDSGICLPEQTSVDGSRIVEKGALHYAERLACHIVSMATEMDTLNVNDGISLANKKPKDSVALHSAQFSEQTLNSLWTYAGEIAGEVISDVKRMMSSKHCHHKAMKKSSEKTAEGHHHGDQADCHLSTMADHWSNEFLTSVLNPHGSCSSGMSSEFPSCESVTDEYAGHLIKVLKKEGGSRELILDQYASRLAYRSIKSGLAHAARRIKQRSPLRLHSPRHLYSDGSCNVFRIPTSESSPSILARGKEAPSGEFMQCLCQTSEDRTRSDYIELVNFAESLAYSITCDVTRKLRMSSVRLPKSLTDSCLYKKSKLEDMAENLIKTTFSCSLLPYTEKNRQYHSTGSLNDSNYNNGVLQVIEHYARKIVDDTLEMTLGAAGHQATGDRRSLEQSSHAEKQAECYKSCQHCQERDGPFCRIQGRHHFQSLQKRRQESDAVNGLEIPKIHIDLDKRAVFAEEMVSRAIEKAKKELSSTSLNADSGIGHDGASFAESLTTEIMMSAMSNVCQNLNFSAPGKEGINVTESTVSQQLSLSVGDDSLGSWSNLSFEDDHPDESSSFHHLSDSSNGNSSSWSSLGLEGEVYEEHLSFSPSDSDCTEEKETEAKEDLGGAAHVDRGHTQGERVLLVVSTDVREQSLDPQLRAVLQWLAASITELPSVQLGQHTDQELQQLPAVVQTLRERDWRIGDLVQALIKYYEEYPLEEDQGARGGRLSHKSLFQWLLEHA